MPSFVILNGPISRIRYALEQRHFRHRNAKEPFRIYYDRKYHVYACSAVPNEVGSLEYVASEIVRGGLIYHFLLDGARNHEHSFDAVLLRAYNDAERFELPQEFRGEYSPQELALIDALMERGRRDRAKGEA